MLTIIALQGFRHKLADCRKWYNKVFTMKYLLVIQTNLFRTITVISRPFTINIEHIEETVWNNYLVVIISTSTVNQGPGVIGFQDRGR